jgi:osmotically-inducible protein OsmY
MRTDQQLKQDVTNELKWEPSVNEAHIGVSAKNGIVTLSGHVPTYGEKYGAEKAAKRVFGVKALANELDVKLGSDQTRSDEDVAVACLAALRAHASVPDGPVKIVVNDGWVKLEGTVEWQYQKAAAEDAIRHLIGVRGVQAQRGDRRQADQGRHARRQGDPARRGSLVGREERGATRGVVGPRREQRRERPRRHCVMKNALR